MLIAFCAWHCQLWQQWGGLGNAHEQALIDNEFFEPLGIRNDSYFVRPHQICKGS
jgi:hypothetical protein